MGSTAHLKSPVVNIAHVSKRFGATQALDDVSLTINSGEVLALLLSLIHI